MRLTDLCWVELDLPALNPIAIFKNQKQAILAGVTYGPMVYGEAVEKIRRAVFERDQFACTHCGEDVTWGGVRRGHMHERVWRGKGGQISVANSTTLCYNCHMNSPAGHGSRKPQWGLNG